jgi:hypothetical protein
LLLEENGGNIEPHSQLEIKDKDCQLNESNLKKLPVSNGRMLGCKRLSSQKS